MRKRKEVNVKQKRQEHRRGGWSHLQLPASACLPLLCWAAGRRSPWLRERARDGPPGLRRDHAEAMEFLAAKFLELLLRCAAVGALQRAWLLTTTPDPWHQEPCAASAWCLGCVVYKHG